MKVQLNRQSIDSFQNKANEVFELSKELIGLNERLRIFAGQLKTLTLACRKNQVLLTGDVPKLSETINRIKEKLKKLKNQLSTTQKTIPGPTGVIPNPIYVALKLEAVSLVSKIADYPSKISDAMNKISKLSDFVSKAEETISFIEKSSEQIETISIKSSKNSNEVVAKMTKIKRVITRYINTTFSLSSVSDIKTLFNFEPRRYGRLIEKTQSNSVQVLCRREELAGTNHPVTGIPYERYIIKYSDGITREIVAPKFPTFFTATLEKSLYTVKERIKGGQFEECTRQLKERINSDWRLKKKFTDEQIDQIENLVTPRGYTWHHEPEEGKISLVTTRLHQETGHTGGRNLWGGGSKMR